MWRKKWSLLLRWSEIHHCTRISLTKVKKSVYNNVIRLLCIIYKHKVNSRICYCCCCCTQRPHFYVSLVCLISDDEYWYTCQIRLHLSCIVSMMKTNILQDFSEGFVNIRCRQPQSPLAFNLISCLPGPYLIQDTIRIYQDIYILTAKEEGLQTKTIIIL